MTFFRLLYSIAAVCLLATVFPPCFAGAQNHPQVSENIVPSDDTLDLMLQSKDWTNLDMSLSQATHDKPLVDAMNWLHAKVEAGSGGVLLAYLLTIDLARVGDAVKEASPDKDLRLSAGMMALYTYELIAIDGVKCADSTAPRHHQAQFFTMSQRPLAYLKAQPAEIKIKVIGLAQALENKTALTREDDDFLCREGDEEATAIKANVGKNPSFVWSPAFVAPEIYTPQQKELRKNMVETLKSLVQ